MLMPGWLTKNIGSTSPIPSRPSTRAGVHLKRNEANESGQIRLSLRNFCNHILAEFDVHGG